MMGQITVDQSHQVMATLIANADWSQIDFEKLGLQELIIRKPREAGRQFTAFLKNGGRMTTSCFPTWKTIKLGTHKNVDSLKKAITKKGIVISSLANDIMSKPTFILSSQEDTIELVIATVGQLGFSGNARYDEICSRIEELGYALCPAEVGPQLGLQYPDQPEGEYLYLAMESIVNSNGCLNLFEVGHRWLRACCGLPGNVWGPGGRFVFVRCK